MGKDKENPGKGKGKVKMAVCQLDEETGQFKYKTLPSHVALKFIDAGKAKAASSPADCEALNGALDPEDEFPFD